MIRVVEAQWERGAEAPAHDFPEATDFNVQPNGALIVLGEVPTSSPADPGGPTRQLMVPMIAAFSDGAWDQVIKDPDTNLQGATASVTAMPGPTAADVGPGASSPSTDIPDAVDLSGGPEASGPPGSENAGAGFTESGSVMTGPASPGPIDPEALSALEETPGPITDTTYMDPGLKADENTKVVLDGQGQPVVMKKNPDGSWRTVSPDDVAVPPGVPSAAETPATP